MLWYRAKLHVWQEEEAIRGCRSRCFGSEATVITSDEYLKENEFTVRYSTPIGESSNLRRWTRDWAEMRRYGAEVLGILHQDCTQGVYGSEVTKSRRANRDTDKSVQRKKKGGIESAPSVEEQRAQRKEARLTANGFKPPRRVITQEGRRGSSKLVINKRTNSKPDPVTA